MLIVRRNYRIAPYVELSKPVENIDRLIDHIQDYIIEKSRQSHYQDELVRILHLSGLAEYHHTELANYLNRQLKKNFTFKKEAGEFSCLPVKHWWLTMGDLIVDITIKQFKNKPHLLPSYLQTIAEADCYISNDPQSIIYKLYKKSDGTGY